MSAAFQRRTFAPGEPIFSEGDPGDSLYIVERGRVEIWKGAAAQRVAIGHVEAGGVFGEMAIFDKQPRMANASAETECTLMRMPATVLRQSLYGADPMLHQLVQILVDNIRKMAARIDELERRAANPP